MFDNRNELINQILVDASQRTQDAMQELLLALNRKSFFTLEQEKEMKKLSEIGKRMGEAGARLRSKMIEEVFFNENPFGLL